MRPLVGEERREFQRLRIDPPVSGRLANLDVSILEMGVLGARVQHADPIDAGSGELHFSFDGKEIALRCEVVRTITSDGLHYSGVRFVAAVGESGDHLRDMLGKLVARELEARRDLPKSPAPDQSDVDGDKTVRGKDASFLCYRLENGRWRKQRAFLPEQPATGFTVAQWVDGAEVRRLCQVYEAADEEGRRLIRLFAELSVSDELQIPPRA